MRLLGGNAEEGGIEGRHIGVEEVPSSVIRHAIGFRVMMPEAVAISSFGSGEHPLRPSDSKLQKLSES